MAIQLPVDGGAAIADGGPASTATGPEATGSPDGSAASNTYGDWEMTGGVSQLDGTPVVRYTPPGKTTVQTTTLDAMKRDMEGMGLSEEELETFWSDGGVDIEKGEDGSYSFGDISFTNARGERQTFGRSSGGGYTRPSPSGPGAAARPPEGQTVGTMSDRSRGQSGGNASGATGGSARGSTSGGGGAAGGGGGTQTSEGGLELGTSSGPGGAPPIDPNAALGIDFGAAQGGFSPGDRRYSDPGVFGSVNPFTDQLGPDASLNDILLGAMGEQRAQRDLSLGISGGLATGFEDSALRQGAEQGALGLMENPFSLDDRTIQRIQGQQGELIGRNAERLGQASADRAASAGISRSGLQQADQDRIGINAARQLGDVQRGLLVEQATRRPGEIAAATQLGTDVLQQQQGARERIAGGAINTLNQSDVSADAAVLGTLASGGTPQINVAHGPGQGAFGSRYYSGPDSLNPFN